MNPSHPARRLTRPLLSPDEYRRQRRERRMGRTARLEDQVAAWATQHGFSLRVLNDGHHWLFQKAGFMAEWWPSSAKLVVKRDYGSGLDAPHWADVVNALQPTVDSLSRAAQ
jgi:hypothetical protein